MKLFNLVFLLHLLIQSLYCENNKSIEITADTMEWDNKQGQAVALGNAKAIKGNTIIKADKIIAVLDSNNEEKKIKKLLANGNVELTKDGQVANSIKAVYHLDQDKVIMIGSVKLIRDANIIKGEKLIIDFQTGLSKMVGSNSKEKVKMKYSTD